MWPRCALEKLWNLDENQDEFQKHWTEILLPSFIYVHMCHAGMMSEANEKKIRLEFSDKSHIVQPQCITYLIKLYYFSYIASSFRVPRKGSI